MKIHVLHIQAQIQTKNPKPHTRAHTHTARYPCGNSQLGEAGELTEDGAQIGAAPGTQEEGVWKGGRDRRSPGMQDSGPDPVGSNRGYAISPPSGVQAPAHGGSS